MVVGGAVWCAQTAVRLTTSAVRPSRAVTWTNTKSTYSRNQNILTNKMFRRHFSSASPSISSVDGKIDIKFERGLPLLTVPLPSRNEFCQFSLRPLSDTVGSLCANLRTEDKGIDYVSIHMSDGVRISSSTSVEHLLQFTEFRLRINDRYFNVHVPQLELEITADKIRQLDDLKATVANLHTVLCVDEYKLSRERRLVVQLETAETALKPLQEQKVEIERECEAHTERVMWAGFAAMGIQTGLFARLTWWEYSWDIMEPVTYFATFSTVVASFGYYLYSKQPFEYPNVRNRVFTKQFYKRASKQGFDIENYNKLATEVEEVREQLSRLRDPLFQHLPISHLSRLEKQGTNCRWIRL